MARALIVENDNDIAALYAEWLRRAGHEADHSMTAIGAIERLLQTKYDVVTLDVVLTSISDSGGLVVALALRGAGYDGPIILVTGGIVGVDETITGRIGLAATLRKPIVEREFMAAITANLGGAK